MKRRLAFRWKCPPLPGIRIFHILACTTLLGVGAPARPVAMWRALFPKHGVWVAIRTMVSLVTVLGRRMRCDEPSIIVVCVETVARRARGALRFDIIHARRRRQVRHAVGILRHAPPRNSPCATSDRDSTIRFVKVRPKSTMQSRWIECTSSDRQSTRLR